MYEGNCFSFQQLSQSSHNGGKESSLSITNNSYFSKDNVLINFSVARLQSACSDEAKAPQPLPKSANFFFHWAKNHFLGDFLEFLHFGPPKFSK